MPSQMVEPVSEDDEAQVVDGAEPDEDEDAPVQPLTKEQKKEKEDPVIQEYDVYLTKEQQQQIYLLQYPNRDHDQTFRDHVYPSAMRIKPQSGFMEMDLPIHFTNFDRARGVRWGEALRQVKDEGNTGGLGIAGGFGGPPGRMAGVKKKKKDEPKAEPAGEGGEMKVDGDTESEDKEFDTLLKDFDRSEKEGRVLNKQTLGGQIISYTEGQPVYMLGAFKGKELHLTRLAGLVQMRPQFHHVDALKRVETTARRRVEAANLPAPNTEPRAVIESLKPSGADGDEASSQNSLVNFLNKAREERWVDLVYNNEDTEEAYGEYFDTLLPEEQVKEALISNWDDVRYLEEISAARVDPSGRSKKRPMTRAQMKQVDAEEDDPEQRDGEEQTTAGAGAAAAPSAGRKGKGRA